MVCILKSWVTELPIRYQGTLLTGIRGCDVAPKNPICIDERFGCSTGDATAERELVAYLRYLVLHPADSREIDIPGAWFKSRPPTTWKPSQFGHYPLHWNAHIMHCFEICAYCYTETDDAPDQDPWFDHRTACLNIYERMVRSLHLNPETQQQMRHRLTEDRIASGEVVS